MEGRYPLCNHPQTQSLIGRRLNGVICSVPKVGIVYQATCHWLIPSQEEFGMDFPSGCWGKSTNPSRSAYHPPLILDLYSGEAKQKIGQALRVRCCIFCTLNFVISNVIFNYRNSSTVRFIIFSGQLLKLETSFWKQDKLWQCFTQINNYDLLLFYESSLTRWEWCLLGPLALISPCVLKMPPGWGTRYSSASRNSFTFTPSSASSVRKNSLSTGLERLFWSSFWKKQGKNEKHHNLCLCQNITARGQDY